MDVKSNIRLNMLGLPVMQDISDMSKLVHISDYTIYQLSICSDKHYKIYEIAKKSGGKREICQPTANLKGLQGWILVNILNRLKVSSSCKGFELGSSTADNARPHIEATVMLTMDLSNFFGTVTSKQVYNVFKSLGYNKLISTTLTNICTYNGYLPQGGPCSPKLANLVTWRLDKRIQGYVGRRGVTYTRYADDLTFSGMHPSKVVKIAPMIKLIIEDEGFKLNKQKTRVAGSSKAKIVTGLIISNGAFGIGKKKYKLLRSKIHHLTLPNNLKTESLIKEIIGWLSYLNSVDKSRLRKAQKYISELVEKYPNSAVKELQQAKNNGSRS